MNGYSYFVRQVANVFMFNSLTNFMKTRRPIEIFATVLVSSFLLTAFVYATTTVGSDVSIGGNLTVSGTTGTTTIATGQGFTVGSSQFVVQQNSGNVGINTSNPLQKFQVNDTATAAFVVTSAGQVGIGTTSPSNLLTVSGNGNFTGHAAIGSASAVNGGSLWQYWNGAQSPNIIDAEETFTDLSSGGANGMALTVQGDPNADNFWLTGGELTVFTKSGNTKNSGYLKGFGSSAFHEGSGTVTRAIGASNLVGTNAGTIVDAYGIWSTVNTYNSASMTTARAIWARIYLANTSSIGTAYGVYIEPPDKAVGATITNNYGLYIGDQSAASSNSFNIYSAGNGKNYFAGSVGIGTTTPATSLQVTAASANATTTMEFGKANQNKGTCLKMYDAAGTLKWVSIQGGILTVSDNSCQ